MSNSNDLKVTDLQAAMILKIASSEYNGVDGEKLEEASDSQTWADCIIESAQDKGVFTSLLNSEMVYHIPDGRDSVVGLTEKGFKCWKLLSSEAA